MLGKIYPPEKIVESADVYCILIEAFSKEPTIDEFTRVSKIGIHNFALKIIHYCKCRLEIKQLNQGHCYFRPLSMIEPLSEGTILDFHCLHLN